MESTRDPAPSLRHAPIRVQDVPAGARSSTHHPSLGLSPAAGRHADRPNVKRQRANAPRQPSTRALSEANREGGMRDRKSRPQAPENTGWREIAYASQAVPSWRALACARLLPTLSIGRMACLRLPPNNRKSGESARVSTHGWRCSGCHIAVPQAIEGVAGKSCASDSKTSGFRSRAFVDRLIGRHEASRAHRRRVHKVDGSWIAVPSWFVA